MRLIAFILFSILAFNSVKCDDEETESESALVVEEKVNKILRLSSCLC